MLRALSDIVLHMAVVTTLLRSFAAGISLPSFDQMIPNYTSTFKCHAYLLNK